MTTRILASLAVLAALLTACGDDQAALALDEGRVTCTPGRTELDAAVMDVRSDGAHFVIDNQAGKPRHVYVRVGDDRRAYRADVGESTFVATHRPGDWTVICSPESIYPDDGAAWVPVEVRDAGAVWVAHDLACEHPTSTHPDYQEYFEGGLPTGTSGDPLTIARSDLGGWFPIEAGDVVEPAGYPQSSPRIFAVGRAGQTVAVADYRSDGRGGWFFGSVSWCDESI